MKQIKLFSALLAMAIFTLFSCENMNDFHFEYIEDGEIKYTTKVDSVETFAGDGRIKIMGILNQPFGVEEVRVYYNDFTDSFIVDYVRENEVDTLAIFMENMEEKSYAFDIYTGNSEGSKSVRVTTFGTVYGELYRVNLLGRAIDSDSTRDSNIYLSWLPADEMGRGTEIKYTNSSGSELTMELPQDSGWIALTDFGSGISYRSSYVPEVTALDTFYSDWVETEMQIFESQGLFSHPLLGDTPFGFDKILKTVGANTYETYFADQIGNREGTRMKLKVDELNNVDITFVGSTYVIEPNGSNTFDPGTGVFSLNYKYDWTLGARTITETLTLR